MAVLGAYDKRTRSGEMVAMVTCSTVLRALKRAMLAYSGEAIVTATLFGLANMGLSVKTEAVIAHIAHFTARLSANRVRTRRRCISAAAGALIRQTLHHHFIRPDGAYQIVVVSQIAGSANLKVVLQARRADSRGTMSALTLVADTLVAD